MVNFIILKVHFTNILELVLCFGVVVVYRPVVQTQISIRLDDLILIIIF